MFPSSVPLICPGGATKKVHDWYCDAPEYNDLQGVLLCPDHDGCPSNDHGWPVGE